MCVGWGGGVRGSCGGALLVGSLDGVGFGLWGALVVGRRYLGLVRGLLLDLVLAA